jgi:hypothetical protein
VNADQTVDVIFEVDDEDNQQSYVEDKAWDALWEQTNWGDHKSLSLPHGFGWSSAMLKRIEKIEVPHMDREIDLPSEGKPVIGCIFKYKDERYRCTGFFKVMEKNGRTRIVNCLPDDKPEFVQGGNKICPIKDIEIVEMVQWSDETIKQEQGNYINFVKKAKESEYYFTDYSLDNSYTQFYLDMLK